MAAFGLPEKQGKNLRKYLAKSALHQLALQISLYTTMHTGKYTTNHGQCVITAPVGADPGDPDNSSREYIKTIQVIWKRF